jgi:hypothetical protein
VYSLPDEIFLSGSFTMAKARKEASHAVTFAKGGSGHMFGEQSANKVKAGQTAKPTGDAGGKFAAGGSGKMFGFRPSTTQTAGRTSSS